VTKENRDLQALMVLLGNKAFKVNKDHVVLKVIRAILAQTERMEQTVKRDHKGSKDLEG
jgi:hypothetical protein